MYYEVRFIIINVILSISMKPEVGATLRRDHARRARQGERPARAVQPGDVQDRGSDLRVFPRAGGQGLRVRRAAACAQGH